MITFYDVHTNNIKQDRKQKTPHHIPIDQCCLKTITNALFLQYKTYIASLNVINSSDTVHKGTGYLKIY